MSGYVMCYVAHEAVLGLTDLKCYTVLPDSLVYACLCYFHLLPCFLAGALSLYCIVGMPLAVLRGLDAWPYARVTRTVGPVGTYINTLKPPTFGGWVRYWPARCPVVPFPLSRCRCPFRVGELHLWENRCFPRLHFSCFHVEFQRPFRRKRWSNMVNHEKMR